MIVEIALLNVRGNEVSEFEESFKKAQHIINQMPGFKGINLRRSADSENKYLLEVKWRAIDDHVDGFRKSQEYQEWKKLLHRFYNPVPKVEYFIDTNILEV